MLDPEFRPLDEVLDDVTDGFADPVFDDAVFDTFFDAVFDGAVFEAPDLVALRPVLRGGMRAPGVACEVMRGDGRPTGAGPRVSFQP